MPYPFESSLLDDHAAHTSSHLHYLLPLLAIRLFMNSTYDLSQMPLMTGVEASSHVRALGSPLFIVGCTGNALRSDQDEYLSAGADCILTKPIKQTAIEECIREARKRLAGESRSKDLGRSR